MFFCSRRTRFATHAGHIPPTFFSHKRADKQTFPMRIQILSVIFIACKVAKCKGKNADCERKIIRKKPPSLARLSGNSVAFLPVKQLAYRAHKQPQMRRSAVELRRSHSFIPLKAASIPAKNRLGSMKNSLKKQSRNSQKRVQFSSKPAIFFVRVSL